jgi:hypothetical protein
VVVNSVVPVPPNSNGHGKPRYEQEILELGPKNYESFISCSHCKINCASCREISSL